MFGSIRVEHFDNALKMGEHVAQNLLGTPAVFDDPHWFWSDQYDAEIQMAGFATEWDDMVVRGSIEDRSFSAFLLKDGRLAVDVQHEPEVRRPPFDAADRREGAPRPRGCSPIPSSTSVSSHPPKEQAT